MSVKLISSAILIAIMCQLSHQKSKDDTYKDCETAENSRCFGLPDGCVSKKNCMVLLSADPTDSGADFMLYWTRDKQSQDRWVGAAISADNMMGDDSVTECILQKDNSVLVRQGLTYCNKGVNGSICGVNTVEPVRGISKETGSFSDNVLTCSWSRADDSTVKSEDFNIYKQKYYVFLAYGPTNDQGDLKHHTDIYISSDAEYLAQNVSNPSTDAPSTTVSTTAPTTSPTTAPTTKPTVTASTAPSTATPSTITKPPTTGTSQSKPTGSTAAPTGTTSSGNTTTSETGTTSSGNRTTSNPSTHRMPTTTTKPSGSSTSISFNLTLAIFVTIILSLNL